MSNTVPSPAPTLPEVLPWDTGRPRLPSTAVQVKRGQYLVPVQGPPAWRQQEEATLARVVAAARTCPGGVLSHESAALLHGAWLRAHEPDVHLARTTGARVSRQPLPALVYGGLRAQPPPATGRALPRGAFVGRQVQLVRRRRHLPGPHMTTRLGVRVTSLARTIADCLMDLRGADAFVVGDSLLRVGCDYDRFRPERSRTALGNLVSRTRAILRERAGHRGVRRARLMLDLLDPASESPGESETRYWLLRLGLPPVTPQVRVTSGGRTWFIDMGWESARVGVEFDGEGKYCLSQTALYEEKQRQDLLTAAGWRVLRVVRGDLREPQGLLTHVLRAVPDEVSVPVSPRPWMR